VLQIVMTGTIFIVTVTVAAPTFPVIGAREIFLVTNRVWGMETLKFVDAWA
jgi:hypothetical protein